MAWFLQTPKDESPKLLAHIVEQCGPASKGGAAFAFASAMGVKLLAAEPVFQKFLNGSELVAVVGLDAITDLNAIKALKKLGEKHPNFKPKLFLYHTAGSCFHPKTMWLRTAKGGVTITGSGNLTTGGLKGNWEAMTIETLSPAEIDKVEKAWDKWIAPHKKELLELDDPKAIRKAEANKIQRARLEKVLKLPGTPEAEAVVDAVEEMIEEVAQDLKLNPVLIAEVPKSGDRWKQVNFDVNSYQQFFGVPAGKGKDVRFHHVQPDRTLAPGEDCHAVAVKSRNYRFEVGAAQGLAYPAEGHPITIFERVSNDYVQIRAAHAEYSRSHSDSKIFG